MSGELTRREELIDKLMWNVGGSLGGDVALSFIWDTDRPTDKKPDLKSVVSIMGTPDKYTDEELERLLAYSEARTAEYDRIFSIRRGANLHMFDKESETRWYRAKMSWTMGSMWSNSFDEAITFMEEVCGSQRKH